MERKLKSMRQLRLFILETYFQKVLVAQFKKCKMLFDYLQKCIFCKFVHNFFPSLQKTMKVIFYALEFLIQVKFKLRGKIAFCK